MGVTPKPGDPCPDCGQPLIAVPAPPDLAHRSTAWPVCPDVEVPLSRDEIRWVMAAVDRWPENPEVLAAALEALASGSVLLTRAQASWLQRALADSGGAAAQATRQGSRARGAAELVMAKLEAAAPPLSGSLAAS
jgi:hypothetical protein